MVTGVRHPERVGVRYPVERHPLRQPEARRVARAIGEARLAGADDQLHPCDASRGVEPSDQYAVVPGVRDRDPAALDHHLAGITKHPWLTRRRIGCGIELAWTQRTALARRTDDARDERV